MRTALLLVAVAAVIGGLLLWSSIDRRDAAVPLLTGTSNAEPPASSQQATRAAAGRATARVSEGDGAAGSSSGAADAGGVRLRLVDALGVGAPGLVVRATAGPSAAPSELSDADGWVVFDASGAGRELAVELVQAEHGPLAIPPAHVAALDAPEPEPFLVPEFGFVDVLSVTHARGVELDGCTLAAFAGYGLADRELTDAACLVRLPLTRPWRVPVTLPVAGDASTGVVHLHVDVPGALRSEHVAVERPRRAGDARAVSVVLGSSRVLLFGRVLEGTSPLRHGAVLLVVAPREVWGAAPGAQLALDRLRSSRTLDAEGRFWLDLTSYWIGVPSDVFVETSDGRAARVPVTPIGPVEHDLGDLWLETAPLLASGVLVDEAGAPLAGVRVGDREHDRWDPAWQGFPERWALSGSDGAFELRGARMGSAQGARFPLFARKNGLAQSRPIGVAPGTREVRIVMAATGSVAGRVVIAGEPLAVDPARVVLRAVRSDAAAPNAPWYDAPLDAHGRFFVDGVPAGEYEALLGAGYHLGDATPRLAAVVVRAAEVARDPRMDPWDVASDVRIQEVRLATASGPVTCPISVAWRRTGADDDWHGSGFAAAEQRSFLVPTGAVDLSIRSFEHGAQTLAAVHGPVEVELRAAPRLVLRPSAVELPAGASLRPRLVETEAPGSHDFFTELDWQPDGSHTGFVTRPGTFRVQWRLQLARRSAVVAERASFVLELSPADGDRDVVVPIDAECLREAIAELERSP